MPLLLTEAIEEELDKISLSEVAGILTLEVPVDSSANSGIIDFLFVRFGATGKPV